MSSCQYVIFAKCCQTKMSQIVTKTWHHMIIWLLHQNKRFSTHFFFRNLRLAILEVAPTLFLMSCHVIMSLCHFCHMLSRFCHNFGHFWADSTWQKWHTVMMTWHNITKKVTHTSTRTIYRFLKKNGVKTFKIEGVRAILVTWCLKKPKFSK